METTQRAAILGTAGHIDHGKSALIRALTGTDTDRLPEEKARGISIELGFAFLDLPGDVRVGIVDVPGHERFVKQMLAGAGGMDLVLLVVAADEGVMPQTREHLDIVNLLEIPDGFVVLTKCDLVSDPEWLDVVELDVGEAVEGTVFADKPVIRCSAKTGQGIPDVRAEIEARLHAARFQPRSKETRLPVDRVFTLQGFGTVVTGTLWGGSLSVGDPVRLLPEDIPTRIKSVHVHDTEVRTAHAGQRVAVSLHRVDKSRLSRGDWVVVSDVLRPSHIMDAWFRLLPSRAKPLANRARVRVHIGASETLARLVLLDRDELKPGERAPVQLRLESPAVAERGDHYVVRAYSPMATIGGGVIVLPSAAKRKRHQGDVSAEFRRQAEVSPADRLVDAVRASDTNGLNRKALRETLDVSAEELSRLVEEVRATGAVVGDNRLFARSAEERAEARILDHLDRFHAAHPYAWGSHVGDVKRQLGPDMNALLFDLARERLLAEGRTEEREDLVALSGRVPSLSGAAREEADALLARLTDNGFAPPELHKVVSADAGSDVEDLVGRLVVEGEIVRVSQEFVYAREQIEAVRDRLRTHFAAQPHLSVADAKELLGGLTRKHIVPLLEFCDRSGWTRRDGDGRVKGGGL